MAAHTGAKHHGAKMTTAQVRQARKTFAAGKTKNATLARRYGVAPQTMWSILNRKTWVHVA